MTEGHTFVVFLLVWTAHSSPWTIEDYFLLHYKDKCKLENINIIVKAKDTSKAMFSTPCPSQHIQRISVYKRLQKFAKIYFYYPSFRF